MARCAYRCARPLRQIAGRRVVRAPKWLVPSTSTKPVLDSANWMGQWREDVRVTEPQTTGRATARRPVAIPQPFREFGRWQREGDAGVRWLAALPRLIAEQCARWHLRIDHEMSSHGDNAVAVSVRRDGQPSVLKMTWPDASVAEQVLALRLWDGNGSARLLEADPERGALLLERLDHRSLRDLTIRRAVPVIAEMLRRLAIRPPDGLRTTGGIARQLRVSLPKRWEVAGRPFSSSMLDTALGLAADLSTDHEALLVNHDLHYDQVLAGDREPWLVIDPLIVAGALEYQVGQLLWTRFDEIVEAPGLRWCVDALVDAAALDATLARSWAVLRATDYWLWGLAAGFTGDPVRCRGIVKLLDTWEGESPVSTLPSPGREEGLGRRPPGPGRRNVLAHSRL